MKEQVSVPDSSPAVAGAAFRCLQVCVLPAPTVDPYVMEEDDPARCGALESSLWEVKVRSSRP